MQHFYDDLIRDLKENKERIATTAVSKVHAPDEYARLVGMYYTASFYLDRVETDYNNWRSGQ